MKKNSRAALRRLTLLVLIAMMLLPMTLQAQENEPPEDGLYYSFFSNSRNRYAIVIRYDGLTRDLVIPEKVDAYPVREIDKDACRFACLETVTLPETIQQIDEEAFYCCTILRQINLPDGIKWIRDGAFRGCIALTEVILPTSLKTIEAQVFYGCTGLTKITIPVGVQEIEDAVFFDCSGLAHVFYEGSEAEWSKIVIGSNNDPLLSAEIHFNYDRNHEHSYQAVVTPPTCAAGGYTTFICSCGDSYIADEKPPLYHVAGSWTTIKAPTCLEDGIEEATCANCGHKWTAVAYARGHSYYREETPPTCTEAGAETYICMNCGDSYVSKELPSLGHQYEDGTCTRCGEDDPDYEEPVENPFSDVPEGQWFFEPVLWALENGVTSGTSATTFAPNATCTRAQVVTFLWRAMGQPEPETDENPFSDVMETDYFYKAVLWAVENGITSGTGGGKFSHNNPCTRNQVVTFLWRTMGQPEPETTDNPFNDVPEGIYYYNPVLWAVENNITSGTSAATFAPNTDCTRAQVVTFLYRALKDI